MGISSMPAPSEGVMTLLVMNTVLTISIMKQIVHSVLRFVGIRMADPGADGNTWLLPPPPPAAAYCAPSEPSAAERFRSRFKPIRFGAARRRAAAEERSVDCRVCLARFEPESVVDRLGCGHLFHRACLEKWLDYQHVTCPLCRTHVFPG